ncbi:MAG TPA: hypothetical protein VIV40_25960 [Kofleriaceae bacterium]
MDLTRLGFAIGNEWYWKITEGAQTFDAVAAVRDFLAPLARHAKGKLAITEIASEVDEVSFVLGDTTHAIKIYAGVSDRVSVKQFVIDIDRALMIAKTGYQFALVVPRRYELRGVLLTDDELTGLAANAALLVPSARQAWQQLPPS